MMGFGDGKLDQMQTICTSLKTHNHTNTSSLNLSGRMLFMTPNQQCQSTEAKHCMCTEEPSTDHTCAV